MVYNRKETTARSHDYKRKDIFQSAVMSLTDDELDEVFAYMVKNGYIKFTDEKESEGIKCL